MTSMYLTYYGHSCFTLEAEDYRIAMDPYADGSVPGLAPLNLSANEVFCSHDHADHGAKEKVKLMKSAFKSPFTVSSIPSYHDDHEGKDRGLNTIYKWEVGDLSVAHLGDQGCPLSEAQIQALEGVTVLLIPVGGHFTIDPIQAKQIMDQLHPRLVIPMHYRSKTSGYDVIGTLDDFMKVCPNTQVVDDNTCLITEEGPSGILSLTAK